MKGLGRPMTKERPDGYDQAVKAVLDNEMSRKDAARTYGINYAWFCQLFNRDYPDFKPKTDWQKKITKEIGKANRKTESWLEAYIGDEQLCAIIKEKGLCPSCPRNCVKKHRTKGLARQISEMRVPILKDNGNPLEATNA